MAKYKIPNERPIKNKWIIQKLVSDFELLDVWEYPVCFKASENNSLYRFRKNAFNFSITGIFFSFSLLC